MRNKMTIVLMSGSGSRIHQATVSRKFILISTLFAGLLLISFISAGINYYHLKKNQSNNALLQEKIGSHVDEIAVQREQIRLFANEINTLKSKLVELNDFEKKIRIIANLEQSGDSDNLFGVGGTNQEDLDVSLSIKEKHNGLIREMHERVDSLDSASQKQHYRMKGLLKDLSSKRNILASTPSILPTTGWISSRFGYRTSPFTGIREFHKGLDIANRKGTAIIATADGIVTYSKKKGLLGNLIVLDHGHGVSTRYGHCSDLLKKPGERVKRGDVIAKMGDTGRSTGPHLHYEVRLNGVQVSPEKYIFNMASLKGILKSGS